MRTYGETIEVRTVDPEVPDPTAGPITGSAAGPAAGAALEASSSSQLLLAPPAQFLWRGRLYLVREVLAHWVELGTWWTARAPRTSESALPPTASSSAPATSSGSRATPGYPVVSGYAEAPVAARSVAADVGAVEREVWRVEAASGRTARIGVYDLVRDVPAAPTAPLPGGGPAGRPAARWRLARALD